MHQELVCRNVALTAGCTWIVLAHWCCTKVPDGCRSVLPHTFAAPVENCFCWWQYEGLDWGAEISLQTLHGWCWRDPSLVCKGKERHLSNDEFWASVFPMWHPSSGIGGWLMSTQKHAGMGLSMIDILTSKRRLYSVLGVFPQVKLQSWLSVWGRTSQTFLYMYKLFLPICQEAS